MATIKLAGFLGEVPRISPPLLQNNNAQFAENCDLISGEIKTWDGLSDAASLAKDGDVLTIHWMNEQYWLHWTEDIDVAKVPLPGDVSERTVFTGLDAPRVTDLNLVDSILDSSGEYPESSYLLGIPAPLAAPSVALNGAPGGGNEETTTYVYTYVREWPSGAEDEGPPSPASNSITVESGQTVDLSSILAPPAGDYGITHKRIYRAVTAGGETALHYVDEIAAATTTYNDAVATADVGETLSTLLYDGPPDDLTSIIALENGVLAGISGNRVCFSEPYQFHAWPVVYQITLDSDGVALGSIGGTVVVGTKDRPYLINGIDPSAMSEIRLPSKLPCLSKKSMVSSELGVFYSSPEGLVLVSSTGGAKNATKGLIDKDTWQSMMPESMHGYYYSGRYFGFYDDGDAGAGFIINYDSGDLTRLPYFATAGYVGSEEAVLYLAFNTEAGNIIRRWDYSGVPQFYTWRSKRFITPPMTFSCAKVISEKAAVYDNSIIEEIIADNAALIAAGTYGCGDIAGGDIDGYPVATGCLTDVPSIQEADTLQFTLYCDGEAVYSKTLDDNDAFRLPSVPLPEAWSVEVSGNRNVKQIIMSTAMREINYA